jgi:hypothetical protein
MTVSLPWLAAGLSGGFVDSWNRILAIGKARTAPGPGSAGMRFRLNQSFTVFLNNPATNPA